MKRFVFIIFIVAFTTLSIKADTVPNVVVKFYDTMKHMSEVTNDSQAVDYRNEMMNCFMGKDQGGIFVPNDFKYWSDKKEPFLSSYSYATRFYKLSYEDKRVDLRDFVIRKTQYISEDENNEITKYIQRIVDKTLSDGKLTITFSDTLIVKNDKIVLFRNALFNQDESVDGNTLEILANTYYSNKEYYKAYHAYEQIVKNDPLNSNAYFQLAVLNSMGKGCKIDRKKANEYAERAYQLGHKEAKKLVYYLKQR